MSDHWSDHPISSLYDQGMMSVRTANCLQNAEIVSWEQLEGRTEKELLRIRNFGRKSLIEVAVLLEERRLWQSVHRRLSLYHHLDRTRRD